MRNDVCLYKYLREDARATACACDGRNIVQQAGQSMLGEFMRRWLPGGVITASNGSYLFSLRTIFLSLKHITHGVQNALSTREFKGIIQCVHDHSEQASHPPPFVGLAEHSRRT